MSVMTRSMRNKRLRRRTLRMALPVAVPLLVHSPAAACGMLLAACVMLLGGYCWAVRQREPGEEVVSAADVPPWVVGVQVTGYALGLIIMFLWGPPLNQPLGWFQRVALGLFVAAGVLLLETVRLLRHRWSDSARVLREHQLCTGGPFALVRHPMYLGYLMATFAAPATFGLWGTGLIFAAVTGWVLSRRIQVEEEGFIHYGPTAEAYRALRKRVPMLLPTPRALWAYWIDAGA